MCGGGKMKTFLKQSACEGPMLEDKKCLRKVPLISSLIFLTPLLRPHPGLKFRRIVATKLHILNQCSINVHF